MLGQHACNTWSKPQSLLALGSGEGGLFAALGASAGGLWLLFLLLDFGYGVTGACFETRRQRSASSTVVAQAGHATLTLACYGSSTELRRTSCNTAKFRAQSTRRTS